ncbi:hypothetical protein RFI_03095, partial [Reticulomyxa filosa]
MIHVMNIDKLHCIWQSIINIGILLVITLNKMHILISVNSLILRAPFENIMKFIMKHKKNKNTKEYLDAMEMYKLIDQNGVIKIIDEESYEVLLEEGSIFLLGIIQKQLKE